jgi:hypothetical protein
VLTPTSLPSTTVGTAYRQTLSASGGTAPYTYSISAGVTAASRTLRHSQTVTLTRPDSQSVQEH